MKKWMNYVAVLGLTAGTASAAWWPFGSAAKDEVVPVVEPARDGQRPQMTPEQLEKQKARKSTDGQDHARMSAEQIKKMKANREEIMKLGAEARNATDPAQKAVLVEQLRTKLTDVSDKMQIEGRKRLEQAEKELERLKERVAEAEQKKSARIEEQLQRILSGEPVRSMDGKRSDGSSKKEGKKELVAPATE
jgi:predicted phage tail protein